MNGVQPIVERILNGEEVCRAEIKEFNASRLLEWVARTDLHHTPEQCKKGKDCPHSPGPGVTEFAKLLISEMPEVCTCGGHR